MNEEIADDVNLVMQKIYNTSPGAKDQEPEVEEEIIHVHHFPDALVIIKEAGKAASTNIPVVESTPNHAGKNQVSSIIPYLAVCTFIFIAISSILFQFYLLFHPPTATIILLLKSQQVSLSGTTALGRVLPPITLSEAQTGAATGHGHQDARAATGTVTFYNGQSQTVTIPQGTTLTAGNGIQIATDQDAKAPPASQTIPPTFGQATVSAHAETSGSSGNIPTGDINQSCCHPSILAQNTLPFHGGQDERDFTVVAHADIDNLSTTLKASLNQSVQGAVKGQLKNGEELVTLSCSRTVTSDHQPGDEAASVKVIVSQTCSGGAVNKYALQIQATKLLTQRANKILGTDYSLLGQAKVTITRSFISSKGVSLFFSSVGTWIYALSHTFQERIKAAIAGKTKREALNYILSLSGIRQASINWNDDTRLPKTPNDIHLILI